MLNSDEKDRKASVKYREKKSKKTAGKSSQIGNHADSIGSR